MIKVVATKSNLIGSKIIKWALNKEASHFAIQIDYLISHSNHRGVNFRWAKKFFEENEIVDSIELHLSLNEEEAIFQSVGNLEGSEYDMKAFWYFAFRALLYKFLNIPIPEKNIWNDPDKFLCVELGKVLPSRLIEGIDLSITDPSELVSHIKFKLVV